VPRQRNPIHQRIRFVRESLGVTQKRLADMTGFNPATISRLESGKTRLSAETIYKIEKALGVSLAVSAEELLPKPLVGVGNAPVGMSGGVLRKGPRRSVGAAIKSLRNERGMTQIELAVRVGVSRLTLRDWETGRHRPTLDSIQRLASVLKADPQMLLLTDPKGRTGDEEADASEAVPTPDFDIHFAPGFSADEMKKVLTALATYYRACGGVGFKVHFQREEALLEEPVNA
jgi:transcriptional regulator with XRE-family HTH domain